MRRYSSSIPNETGSSSNMHLGESGRAGIGVGFGVQARHSTSPVLLFAAVVETVTICSSEKHTRIAFYPDTVRILVA